MNAILQRLKSKTYWVAIIGATLTVIQSNSTILSGFLPPAIAPAAIFFWPIIMVALREMTSDALADK